ncbi:hypothetical protein DFQ27_009234 [Actinomortierella ambigua]|uniref:Uncharacterized protein n=1 Tax=Actinomortierella ambigua TaxID=1343610 RepID=A0A9P6PQH0_9FUNG|nr:hypothetical protein DFQ27_009234 [Actinomortierella ambigua]
MVARSTSAALILACLACLSSATPIPSACQGDACEQSVQSGNVQLGSTTTIVPQTNVIPITNYQPIVRAGSPIVLADNLCAGSTALYNPYCLMGGGGSGPIGMGGGGPMGMGRNVRMGPFIGGGFGGAGFMPGRLAPMMMRGMGRRRGPLMMKRDQHYEKGLKPGCVPSATVSCELEVPGGAVDMGSYVTAAPKVDVAPSTVYQGTVQANAAEIEAAPAAHASLSQESVNLGGHVAIQPVTAVRPEHTYEPAVTSLPTVVDAAAASYQALDQSSVSLGSTVRVQPTTTVRPLTIYQPSIKSLPFKITQITACDQMYGGYGRYPHLTRPSMPYEPMGGC